MSHAHLSRICPEYISKSNLVPGVANNAYEVGDSSSVSDKDEVDKVSQAMLDNVWSKNNVENVKKEGPSEPDDINWDDPNLWAAFDVMIEELQRKKKMCAEVVKEFETNVHNQFDVGYNTLTPPEKQVVVAHSKSSDSLKTSEPLKDFDQLFTDIDMAEFNIEELISDSPLDDGMGCSFHCGVERVRYECASNFMNDNSNAVDLMKRLRKQVVDYIFSEYVSLSMLQGVDCKVIVDYGDEASLANSFVNDLLTLDVGEMISNSVIMAWGVLLNYVEQKKEVPNRFWFNIGLISQP